MESAGWPTGEAWSAAFALEVLSPFRKWSIVVRVGSTSYLRWFVREWELGG